MQICYDFMDNTLIFLVFLYINALNYRYFHIDCSTFFLNKKKSLEIKNKRQKRVFIQQ